MYHFDNSSVLITGATGSIGKALISFLLGKTKVRRIAIFSRDELKQQELRDYYNNNSKLRWFLGDIRDLNRLKRAFNGVDFIVHAAALKQVASGEYNPMEFIKTNIIGSQNVIDAAIDCGVKKVVALSTDKASSPINLYGATKLTADKLFIAANNYSSYSGTLFSVVRYGNIMGSRGSVIPFFIDCANKRKAIPVTDIRMTRFWINIDYAVEFILDSFKIMTGGELYVPKIPSMRIIDLVDAISPNSEIIETGIRPGEKLHEEMISLDDSLRTIKIPNRFILTPVVSEWGYVAPEGEPMEHAAYRSDTNDLWLSKKELREIISSFTQTKP